MAEIMEKSAEVKTSFVEYIRDFIPISIVAVNPGPAGRIAELVFYAELNGDKSFKSDQFQSERQRAACLMSYPYIGTSESVNRALDILELKFLQHKENHHDEKHVERIAELSNRLAQLELSQPEKDIISAPRDWWNG